MNKSLSSANRAILFAEIKKIIYVLALGASVGWVFNHPSYGMVVAVVAYMIYFILVALRYHNALQSLDFNDLPYQGKLLVSISNDIYRIHKKRRSLNKRLAKQVKSQSVLLNAWPDAMIVIDESFMIHQYNNNAKDWLGLSREDIGQYINNIIREAEFIHLLKSHHNQEQSKDNKSSEKKSRAVIVYSPINGQQILEAKLFHFVDNLTLLIFNDVTQRQQVRRMRKDFIANISHELKTPLTSIKGFAELLAEDVSDEQKGYAEDLLSQADRMDSIVHELLQLSIIESASAPSNTEVVSVAKILSNETKIIEKLYSHVDITLDIDTSLAIFGEYNEWQSLISNVLNNVIQHNPNKQSLKIQCYWHRIDDVDAVHKDINYQGIGEPRAILRVVDNGIGVDKASVGYLTERFYQTDVSRENPYENKGAGIGLSIVRNVVERHSGSLTIVSDINAGLDLRCYLPQDRLAKSKPEKVKKKADVSSTNPSQ